MAAGTFLQADLFRLYSSVLLLGNVEFADAQGSTKTGEDRQSVSNLEVVEKAAELLQVRRDHDLHSISASFT